MNKSILAVAGSMLAMVLVARAEEKKADPVKRVTESGLTIIETGSGGGAKVGDKVWIKYVGKLENGTKFDASGDHPETADGLEVDVGRGRVIKGWDEGLQGMNIGDKRTLIIPPALGYGDRANGPIPANSTLTFDVELVGIKR